MAGEATTGSAFLDVFEIMYKSMQSTIAGTGLTIIMMLGYIEYMQSLHAAEIFATLLAAPVRKLRSKYIVAAISILIGVVIGIVLQSSFVIIALMLATIYPVLKVAGCSDETCATAMIIPTLVTISPARTSYYMAISALNLENVSVPEWFVRVQLPVGMIETLVLMVLFIIVNKYFDKKEMVSQVSEQMELKSADDLGVPKYFAVLPLLPLVITVVFSSLVMKTIVITPVGAVLLSLLISFVVHAISCRSLMKAFDGFTGLFKGMGKIMESMGPILLFGTTFAAVITKVGGMEVFINFFGQFASGPVLLGLVSLLCFAILALTGSYMGNVALMFPFIQSICDVSGMDPVGASTACLLVMAAGGGICLVSAANLLACRATNTDIMRVTKRMIVPVIGGAIVAFAVSMFFC